MYLIDISPPFFFWFCVATAGIQSSVEYIGLHQQKMNSGWSWHSLVAAGVEALLPGEAVHAADDPAVEGGPVLAADLPPLAPVLDLHEALGDGHPLPLGVGGPDAYVLHLHRHVLELREGEVGGGRDGGTHTIG